MSHRMMLLRRAASAAALLALVLPLAVSSPAHAADGSSACASRLQTVQPGDYIRLTSGEEGYVVDINWRNTVVPTCRTTWSSSPTGGWRART
ncbi:hypothetical protein SAVIM40S_03760 [Streptomyces avidinii]